MHDADQRLRERAMEQRARFDDWVARTFANKGRSIQPVVLEAMAQSWMAGWLDCASEPAPDESLETVEIPCGHENATGLMVAHPLGDGVVSSAWSWCSDCGAICSEGCPWTVPGAR